MRCIPRLRRSATILKPVTALRGIGDRLLATVAPAIQANADRYRCSWKLYCYGGTVIYSHCCWDDYTGEFLYCDENYDSGMWCTGG
jgi:hypothetical protein